MSTRQKVRDNLADLEMVITIPENLYKATINGLGANEIWDLRLAVKNGTPLPKGHGKLKDADKIANEVNALKDNWNRYGNEYESGRYESYDYAVDTINGADTIIEADTESEE